MSNSTKVLLALAVLVSLLVIGLGLWQKQAMFIVLGVIVLSALIMVGITVFLMRVLRKLSPRTISIIAASIYLVLIVLVFIRPEIPLMAGIGATVAPTVIYLVGLRTKDIELGQGCLLVTLTTVGGLILLALVLLFQRDLFYSAIGSF